MGVEGRDAFGMDGRELLAGRDILLGGRDTFGRDPPEGIEGRPPPPEGRPPPPPPRLIDGRATAKSIATKLSPSASPLTANIHVVRRPVAFVPMI